MNTSTVIDNKQYWNENNFHDVVFKSNTQKEEYFHTVDSVKDNRRGIVDQTFGKYSSKKSLLKSLLRERAIDKEYDK